MARRIFIGSSREGSSLAAVIGQFVQQAGLEPLVWTEVFPAGEVLLDRIEQLPQMIDGAILVVTPDLESLRRATGESSRQPVPNVVFEYGYLSGRLTRKRVAVCVCDGTDVPSDLDGLTVVRASSSATADSLTESSKLGLQAWLHSLAVLASGVAPTQRVHGYSGVWHVQDRFSLWHGVPVEPPELVTWEGTTLLSIPASGQGGVGSQIGVLDVRLRSYRAKWNVSNEVVRAEVDERGGLRLQVEVRARTVVAGSEFGGLAFGAEAELPSPRWEVLLEVDPSASGKLVGSHDYLVAGRLYSRAEEHYRRA